MEQIFRRKTECKFRSVLVDNKKIPNVNLHEISISKIKHPLMFCSESNRERIAFGPLLITVLFLALKKTGFSKKKILPKKK